MKAASEANAAFEADGSDATSHPQIQNDGTMVRLKQFVAKRKSVVDPRAVADFNAAKADTGAAEAMAISADNGGSDPP